MSGRFYDDDTLPAAPEREKLLTREQFNSTIKDGMLDANGRFRGPDGGVNYQLEGMTPDEVYKSASEIYKIGDWSEDNRLGKIASAYQANQMLDAGWREGPDNGGGVLGGFIRSTLNLAKGIASNPALMTAVTAGVGGALSSGVQSATGWTAGTSKAVSSGIINGARTFASGGNLTDVAKSGLLSYAGGQAAGITNSAVNDFTGSPIAAKIAGDLARTAVSGGNLASSLVTSTTNAAVNEITSNLDGFDKLDPYQKGIINSVIVSAIQGKKITPGLIANIMISAQGVVKQA